MPSKTTGAGELSERLTILHFVLTDDGQGGQVSTLETLRTVAGSMRPLSASELLAAKAIESTQTYEARIYYPVPQDITVLMQISWRPYGYAADKVLEIHGLSPDKDEPRRFLLLDLGEVGRPDA